MNSSNSGNETGWGGRIRTFEYRLQRPAPYRLATPQHPGAPATRTLRRGVETLIVAEFSRLRAGNPAGRTIAAVSAVKVRVWSDSQPGRARSFAVRRAASARSNRPNTADPDPDMAANAAPASSSDWRMRPMAGWWRTTGASRSFRSVADHAGQPGGIGARRRLLRRPPRLLVEPRVGIGGRDAEAGTQDHDVHRRQVGERIDVVAAPEAERGAADQEIRHVGAEPRADARQRREIEIELPQLVQREQRHRRIRSCRRRARLPTARACADRSRCRAAPMVLPVATRCSSDAAFHTRLRRSVGMSGSSHVTASGPRRDRHRDVVEQRQRLKDGLEIVVPIGPRSEDAEIEVDLCERREG